MQAFSITGGKPLQGSINISGAKNAALPILFACLLCDSPCRIRNVPKLRDVSSTLAVLEKLGVKCSQRAGTVKAVAMPPSTYEAPYDLVRTMRASILALGPLLARYGQAVVSMPGGCAIGARPIDIHIEGMRQMGANIDIKNGCLVAICSRLHGADITLPFPSVTGTENLMMAAVLAEGETILRQAAQEPEITDLANFLNAAGANVSGAGSDYISIHGVERLGGVDYTVMPDRIEAGTYIAAVAAAGGELFIEGARYGDMERVVSAFIGGGVDIKSVDNGITAAMHGRFRGADAVTAPYPGFPTDMQAQLIAANCIADGQAAVNETVFENRFMHVQELRRLGAKITLNEHTAFISGVNTLTAAPVMATDLRASASLVVAALAASGNTVINRIYHLERGYEGMEKKLSAVGAKVKRIRQ